MSKINKKHEKLFEPIKIGKVQIKNRYCMAPMGPFGLCDDNGLFNEKGIEYYVARAKGGTGLIITGLCSVETEIEELRRPSIPCPSINPAAFLSTSKNMTERVHAYDSKIFLQLTAGFGRVGLLNLIKSNVAPSPVTNRWDPSVKHRELTTEEVETYVRKFAEAAAIAKASGFDGVEIHAVHEGYLLDQFTIALFNQRKDKYGGNLMNRLRFPIEIVQAIKKLCGEDFPVSLRYSIKSYIKGIRQGALPGEEFKELGRDIEEGLEVGKILEEAGYDALDADAGCYDSWYWNHPPMYFEHGMYLPLTKKLKEAVKIPVIVAGRMDDPDLASKALEEGAADMIGLGRPLLADPELPNKIRKGEMGKIRPCLSCHEGCLGRAAKGGDLSCAVNPACGREIEYAIKPATINKKVVIIGGGIAGMEAARVCAIRGHNVHLYEKSGELGGNVVPGSVPKFKNNDKALIEWYGKELKALKVEVNLNTEGTKAMIIKLQADTVVVATGSNPILLKIPGMESKKVFEANQVLLDENKAGQNIVIIGGGLVGCETALWLAQKGKKVTVVEGLPVILGGPHNMPFMNYEMLKDLLNYHKVEIITDTFITGVNEKGAIVKTKDVERVLEADTIIMAVGYQSENKLYKEIKNVIGDVHILGDARKVNNIMYAIWDSYEVARNI